MITRTSIERVQDNLSKVEAARSRVSTGLRVERPSDDPIASDQIMEMSSDLRANEQHQRNIQRGRHRLSVEEQALDGLTNLLSRAREIATQEGGSTAGTTSRQVAAAEVRGLIESAVGLGNTRFGDTFLFGGMYATNQPFAADGSVSATQPPIGSHPIEVDAGRVAETTHDGQTLFLGTAAIPALQSLESALMGGNTTAIASMSTTLDTALDDVQELLGEVGVRSQVLDTELTLREDQQVQMQLSRSEIQDVDLNVAITEMLSHQSALEAALLAVSRAQSGTLVDRL